MEYYAKVVNGFNKLTTFTKCFILSVWQDPGKAYKNKTNDKAMKNHTKNFQIRYSIYALSWYSQSEANVIVYSLFRLHAVRGSSRKKLYQELGLESLQLRRWYRKL